MRVARGAGAGRGSRPQAHLGSSVPVTGGRLEGGPGQCREQSAPRGLAGAWARTGHRSQWKGDTVGLPEKVEAGGGPLTSAAQGGLRLRCWEVGVRPHLAPGRAGAGRPVGAVLLGAVAVAALQRKHGVTVSGLAVHRGPELPVSHQRVFRGRPELGNLPAGHSGLGVLSSAQATPVHRPLSTRLPTSVAQPEKTQDVFYVVVGPCSHRPE